MFVCRIVEFNTVTLVKILITVKSALLHLWLIIMGHHANVGKGLKKTMALVNALRGPPNTKVLVFHVM